MLRMTKAPQAVSHSADRVILNASEGSKKSNEEILR